MNLMSDVELLRFSNDYSILISSSAWMMGQKQSLTSKIQNFQQGLRNAQ
jgi:hypothetical protein